MADEKKAANGGGPAPTESKETLADAEAAAMELLQAELETLRKESAANLDLAKRSQAELANAQARMSRDLDVSRKFALESFARELLSVIDGIDKSVEALTKGGGSPAVVEAVSLIEREMMRVLSKFGVAPIDTKGRKFDPAFHEALTVVESAAHEPQAIVTEMRRGWLMHDRVLRPAQVAVARKPAAASGA